MEEIILDILKKCNLVNESLNEINGVHVPREIFLNEIKYDELKELRENLYKECVPILQDLISINNNIEAIRTLMNIYGTIGDNSGYMEMKNLLEQQD